MDTDGQSTPPTGLFGPIPAVPAAYRPNGDTYSTKPTYSWARLSNAPSYNLVVTDIADSAIILNKTVDKINCSITSGRRSYTPSRILTEGKFYKWKVRGSNTYVSSSFSPEHAFKVLPGFDSSFNGSSTGWVTYPGGSWNTSTTEFYTNGKTSRYSSAAYNGTFQNFTYQPGSHKASQLKPQLFLRAGRARQPHLQHQ